MAQVDSRIAMGVQPLDVGASIGRGYQLRDLAAQADARGLDAQAKQLALKKQTTIGEFHKQYTAGGKLDRAAFSQRVVDEGYGADLAGMQKQWGDNDKDEQEYWAKNVDRTIKTLEYSNKAITSLLGDPEVNPEKVRGVMHHMVAMGLMDANQGAQAAREIPDDPQRIRMYLERKLTQSLPAEQAAKRFQQDIKPVNVGGETVMVDVNPQTNPGIAGQTYQRTLTPEAQLSADTARRGQDKTDLRARDLNATKAEEAKIKREAKDDAANLTKASQLASFDTMLGTLDRLGAHPGLGRSVGVMGALPTIPGSNSANFQAELNTFQSQAFLPMVAQLKGMGALSDSEGKKLTAAVGALDPKMGEEAFRASVKRITDDMQAAKNRMQGGASVPAGAAPAGGVLSPQQAQANPALEQAKAAIAAGADRAKVMERLKGMGIETKGL